MAAISKWANPKFNESLPMGNTIIDPVRSVVIAGDARSRSGIMPDFVGGAILMLITVSIGIGVAIDEWRRR